jgi:hypothetical protein
MAAKELGQIFDEVKVFYDDAVDVSQPVGTSAFPPEPLALKADTQNTALKLFDSPVTLEASASATAQILGAGATINAFEGDTPVAAPANMSWAQLEVKADFSGGVAADITSIPLALSASGAASLDYDHYILVNQDETRLDALTRLVTTAELPHSESLASLRPGEASSFTATLNFDLGIKAKFNKSFDVAGTVKLFDGLSAQAMAKVQYGLEASLGWSIFDEMDVTVGRVQQQDPSRVRVRIDRLRKNTFTAGASFALQVDWDASDIGTVLEKAFDMTPLPRAISALKTVAGGDWDTIRTGIIDRATDTLLTAIAGTGWKEKAAANQDVQEALADIRGVVSFYNGIDAKVQQVWSDLLLRVDLGPDSEIHKAIDTIAGLDPSTADLKQFLSPEAQRTLDLIETLSGKTLEKLILGSPAALQMALQRAKMLASQLQGVLDGTPDRINAALGAFAEKHGIKSAIEFLSQVSTLDGIQSLGDKAVMKLVTTLVGKAFDRIDPADLMKVQAAAQKMLAKWTEISTKLAKAAKLLQGQLGFNASLEFSRVSEVSSLIDFEVDATNEKARGAVETQLRSGNVLKMLRALDAIEPDAAGELPYTIREALFVSRHLRTGVTTVILSFLGLSQLQKVTGTRLSESMEQIIGTTREGTFTGGFSLAVVEDQTSNECGAWISAEGTDHKTKGQPFDSVDRTLRLTFARNDAASTATERGALTRLLSDLGFTSQGNASVNSVPDGAQSVFTLELMLDEQAVNAFLADQSEASWNLDYRNALHRLLQDRLIDGAKLAAVVETPEFAAAWTDTSTNTFKDRFRNRAVGGSTVVTGDDILPPFVPIQLVIASRPSGLRRIDDLKRAFDAPGGQVSTLKALTEAAATFFSATSLRTTDNPMFNFWFVVARLVRLGSAVPAKAVATLRFSTTANPEMSAPMTWTLDPEVLPVQDMRTNQVFVFA